eukprot:1360475-Amphidinium_carterae.1
MVLVVVFCVSAFGQASAWWIQQCAGLHSTRHSESQAPHATASENQDEINLRTPRPARAPQIPKK